MLHAEIVESYHASRATAYYPSQKRSDRLRKMQALQSFLKVTWSTVELDGSQLANSDPELVTQRVIEALNAAKANNREELIIVNIAPDTHVGDAKVAEAQGIIEKSVEEAATKLGVDAPQTRLSLRGKEYDIRCYLGRTKPTDYSFDYDA